MRTLGKGKGLARGGLAVAGLYGLTRLLQGTPRAQQQQPDLSDFYGTLQRFREARLLNEQKSRAIQRASGINPT